GYAPAGKDGLYRHLLGLGFTSRQIVDGGLAVVTASGEHRDRFRGRVTFAISDVSGEVVGFGGRALADEQPKYLNSPETLVYHKGKILYGLDQAKAEMVRRGAAVVAEGYTDVIALHKFGATNAVATCGTALSEEHFATIKRFCDRAVLAFDADAAGAVASERGFGMHTRVGLEVLVAPIPPGKDPADVALGEGGEGVRSMLDHSVPLMLFVLKAELARHRLDTPEGKARAIRAAAALLAWEPSRVARGEHAFWLAEQVGVNPEHVLLELSDLGRVPERAGSPARPPRLPGHVRLEREALALLIDDTRRLEQADGGIGEEHFTEAQHRVVLRALVESAGDPAGGSMMDRLPDTESRRLASRLALAPKTTDEPDEVFRRLEELRLARKIDSFRSTLNQLDPSADTSRCDALFEELMRLEEQRRRFDER
ncbi:MAG: toprim domain-containing protein, partial [Actinomycetota bacterium]